MADSLFNPLYASPNFDPQAYARLQAQQMMAQALMQQGLSEPLQGRMAGNVYVAPSWTQGLAKVLQAYSGYKGAQDAASQMLGMQANAQRMIGQKLYPAIYGQGQQPPVPQPPMPPGQSAPQMPSIQQQGQPAPQTPDIQQQGQPVPPVNGGQAVPAQTFPLPNVAPNTSSIPSQNGGLFPDLMQDPTYQKLAWGEGSGMYPSGTASEYAKATYGALAPTDPMKNYAAAGMPMTAWGQKEMAPVPVGRNGMYYNPASGQFGGLPNQEGLQMIPDGRGGWQQVMTPGVQQNIQQMEAAKLVGQGKTFDKYGNPLPMPSAPSPMVPSAPSISNLVPSVIHSESAGNPNAVSQKGAEGLGQLMPSTANGLGVNPASPVENVAGATSYLGQLRQKYGDNQLALAAYNWGPSKVDSVLKQGGGMAQMPPSVQQYVQTVMQNSQPQQAYGQQPIGAVENKTAAIRQGNDIYTKANADAQNLQQYRQALNEMWNLASTPGVKFGPGTEGAAKLMAYANNAGINMTGAQTAQDVMRKLASNLAISQLQSGGTGSDAQLNTILHSIPNGEMTNAAIQKVIPLLVSQLDVKQARALAASNYLQGNNNDLSSLPGFMTKFNQLAEPGTVSLGKQFSNAMTSGGRPAVMQLESQMMRKYGSAAWPGIKAKIQQLDQMGAF
jgi:Transglycosylase SLT domain